MGLRIPRARHGGARRRRSSASAERRPAPTAPRRRFVEVLPLLAELAELENAVLRLARELRKTQRRCNALSKIFIPNLPGNTGFHRVQS